MQSYGGSEIARNCVQRAGILVSTVQSGASGYEKGFVKWGCTAASKQGELSENILLNLFHNLMPQTVLIRSMTSN